MRRKYTEIVMSIAAVGLVLLVLISFDSRVRQEFSLRMDAGAAAQAANGTSVIKRGKRMHHQDTCLRTCRRSIQAGTRNSWPLEWRRM